MNAVLNDAPETAMVGQVEEPTGSAIATITTPATLLAMAVQQGASMETLERLMDLQDRWDAKQAKNAYVADMAAFKQNPPEILKSKLVSFVTRDGDETSYRHAELGTVCNAVVGALAQHGFSHRWDTKQDAGRIEVTCVITHRLGHSESTMLHGAPDGSGKKNAIQQTASTITYLQRYTLLAATGLATNAMDDDGRGAGGYNAKGEPFEEKTPAEKAIERKAVHDRAFARHSESIAFIRARLANGDTKAAAAEWAAIDQPDQLALWLAPTKGGCLTVEERTALKEAKV